MKWKSPKDELPPQGKKILYFKDGDMYVVQRFGDLWLPIPFHDSRYAFHDAPELWRDVKMPPGYTGKLKAGVEDGNRVYDIDEFEIAEPEAYKDLIKMHRKIWVK